MRSVFAAVLMVALSFAVSGTGLAGEHPPGHLTVSPNEIEWSPVGSLPPGAEAAVLEGDPAKAEPFTMRIRFPANYEVPVHTHPAVERVTVLEGAIHLGIGETFDRDAATALPAGGLAVMEAGVAMYGFTGDEGAVIQLNGQGPWGIDYLDPAKDPRQKQSE